MVNWKEGNIKEVAKGFHKKFGINSITYETTPNSVVFLSDGFLVAFYEVK